jgi:hypothetical protein
MSSREQATIQSVLAPPRRRVTAKAVVIGLLVLVSVTALFHRQIVFAPPSHLLATADIERYFLPIHEYIKSELLAGRVPLWNPYIYAGTPLAANPQVTFFYPPAWINFLMPVVTGQRLLIALHAALAAMFQYLLLRRWGASRPAAMVGAIPWAFGGYMMANAAVGHLTMIFTACWLPLVIYCADRAIAERQPRWLIAAGLVVGVQVLAGEPQNSYYTAVGLTVFMLARGWDEAGVMKSIRVSLARLSAIALIAGAVAAVQLFPTAELARYSDRADNTDAYATAMSFPPRSLIGFVMPWRPDVREIDMLGSTWRRGTRINLYWELSGYVGVLTLVLAGVGIFKSRGPAPRAAKVVLLASVILALGGWTPIYAILLDVMPGLRLFRVPARALLLVVWALSALAGLGAQWIIRDGATAWRETRWRAIAGGAVGVVVIAMVIFGQYELTYVNQIEAAKEIKFPPAHSPVLMPCIVLIACLGLIIAMRWMTRAQAAGAMVALMAIDLFLAVPAFPIKPSSTLYDEHVALLKGFVAGPRSSPARVDFPSIINANAAMTARVENVNGYWPLSIGRFYRFCHEMRGRSPRSGDRHELAPNLYLAVDEPFPLRVLNVRWTSVLTGPKGLRASGREHPAPPPPRAWLASDAKVVSDPEEIVLRMKDHAFDPLGTVYFETPPPPIARGAPPKVSKCDVRVEPGGTVTIRTSADRDAYLVLSQIYYPGWRATVDGQETPIMRADYCISAIRLSAGEHRIRYAYRPTSVRWGAAVSIATLLVVAVGLGADRWWSRRSMKH